MAIARADTTTATEDGGPAPHLFTVDEYYKMAEIGIFDEDSRVELIDGVIYDMPPIGPGHASSFERIADLFRALFGGSASVRHQNPVRLGIRSEPEPDIAIVIRRADYYSAGHPTPADVLLMVEIADSSLAHDRNTKSSAYASAGIREYWIVDLVHSELIVYRDPSRGEYRSMQRLTRDDTVMPVAFVDIKIAVADLLG